MGEDDPDLSVTTFVEYCRTQAGLLAGNVETMSDEIDELLDEIDRELADLRARLDETGDATGTVSPESPEATREDDIDVETVEEAESELERKQTLVEAKQARMTAHQELATAYSELAAELQADVDDGREALERVVEFEAERDAPAYFPDRQTVLEATAEDGDDAGG